MPPLDTLIIGAGQAATPLARALAQAGRPVAVAERAKLGGSCVNFGCTPTKAVLASAHAAHLARRGADFGVDVPSVSVRFEAVLERVQRIVQASVDSLEGAFSDNPRLVRGHARLEGASNGVFRVRVGEERLEARRVVLDTGTRTALPHLPGLEALELLTSENWLEHRSLPERLLILGGGYIGLEMAQFYRRMGAEVTLIHGAGRLLEREDPEVGDALRTLLEGEGVTVHLSSKAVRAEKTAQGVALGLEGGVVLQGSHLFVATGRRPNTDDLGLETVGLEPGKPLEVNEKLETSVKGLYAAGDIRGGLQLTSTSYDDHRVLASQLLGDGSKTTQRLVPYAIYTDPPLARVGLSGSAARERGLPYRKAEVALERVGRAFEDGETQGFVQLLVHPETREVLGATLMMPHADDLIHTVWALMQTHAPYTLLEEAVLAHPTYSEGLQKALMTLEG